MPRAKLPAGFGWSMGAGTPTLQSLHKKVLSGLPYTVVGKLGQAVGVNPSVVLRHAAISPSTFARRKQAVRLNPDESGRVLRIALLFERAAELFDGDRQAAAYWLTHPVRGLGWATPLSLAATEVGAKSVDDLIGRLEYGVFS